MRIGHFTRLKGRTSYFRRKIPLILRSRLASSEICVRLGVLNRDSAERQARRLAVAVDAFFAYAADDPMLTALDLKEMIASTMATWRADDQRRDADMVMAWGRRSTSPKDEAAILDEMANGVLEAQGAGRNMHESAYVQRRLEAAGMPPLDAPMALHLAGRQLSAEQWSGFSRTTPGPRSVKKPVGRHPVLELEQPVGVTVDLVAGRREI